MNFYLGVTKVCNMRCKYCYVPEINKNQYKEVEQKAIQGTKDLIEKLKNEKEQIGNVVLHGAESTVLSPAAISKIVDMIIEVKFQPKRRVSIQTNGIALTKDYLLKLDKNKLKIGFSIDGFEKLHNINRPNSYYKAMANLHTAHNMGFEVSVLSVISKDTIKNIDRFFQWFLKELPPLAASDFKFIHGDKSLVLSKDEQELFVSKCIEYGCVNSLQFMRSNICLNNGNSCEWYEFDMDGDIFSCNKEYGEKPFANWKTDSVENIKRKRVLKFINKPIDKECYECRAFHRCKGGCPLDRDETDKSVDCAGRLKLYDYSIENDLSVYHGRGARVYK